MGPTEHLGAREKCGAMGACPQVLPAKPQLPEAMRSLIMTHKLQPAANIWLSERGSPKPAKAVGEIVVKKKCNEIKKKISEKAGYKRNTLNIQALGRLGGSVGWAADFGLGHDLAVRGFDSPRRALC